MSFSSMKLFRSVIAIFFLISGIVFAQPCNALPEEKENGVFFGDRRQLMYEMIRDFPPHTQFAIGLVDGENVSYAGLLMKNDTVTACDNRDSVFAIGSVTKVFTSVLLAHLVTDSLVNLDDRINDYLPFRIKKDLELTFRELSNHTSGLPRISNAMIWGVLKNKNNPYWYYDSLALEKELKKNVKRKTVRGQFSYSNFGAAILAYAICQVKKETLADLMKSMIFNPYRMEKTFMNGTYSNNLIVKGRDTLGNVLPIWDMHDPVSGMGGLFSTSSDMCRFILAHFNERDKFLILTRQTTFKKSENESIGLGIFSASKDGRTFFNHGGAAGGYSSYLIFDVENKKGIVLLTNVQINAKVQKTFSMVSGELMDTI